MAKSSRKPVIKLQLKRPGKGNTRKRVGGNGTKSKTAALALAQGVGAVNRRPFQMRGSTARRLCDYFNATLPAHLPLPRSVGPYTIVRTTQIVSSSSALVCFAFIASNPGTTAKETQWIAACGVGESLPGPINAANNTELFPMSGLDTLKESAVISPSALTIQVMNPEPLQTTTGIVYCGRSSAQYELGGSTRTWTNLGNEFVQFMAPRLCSAGKLAIRGVTIDSYPLDMTEIADFRGIQAFLGSPFTWSDDTVRPAGFAPIVVYNPDFVGLQYLVTMEWRVRFDPSNPAAGTHLYHGTAPDSLWDRATREAAAIGHGALDIAEKTAEVGAVGYGALEAGATLAAL